jgi:hypothetical protein
MLEFDTAKFVNLTLVSSIEIEKVEPRQVTDVVTPPMALGLNSKRREMAKQLQNFSKR